MSRSPVDEAEHLQPQLLLVQNRGVEALDRRDEEPEVDSLVLRADMNVFDFSGVGRRVRWKWADVRIESSKVRIFEIEVEKPVVQAFLRSRRLKISEIVQAPVSNRSSLVLRLV